MNDYFLNLNTINERTFINEMYEYAKSNNVPIVTSEGLELIKLIIKLTNAKKILEIGTAIAYTSISCALINKDITVDTIERNDKMYELALKNIKAIGLENRINVINEDALNVDVTTLNNDYDLIFIDAAKAQYIRFFEKYNLLLKRRGIIISDNLLFHGLVEKDNIEGKDLRALIRKIKNYNSWLEDNKNFETTFLRIGDGMAISIKK